MSEAGIYQGITDHIVNAIREKDVMLERLQRELAAVTQEREMFEAKP
jgi:hypothetical protein